MFPASCMLLAMLALQGAGADSTAYNLDFEVGTPGAVPPGWWTTAESSEAGYLVRVDTTDPAEGKAAAELRYGGDRDTTEWGWLCQSVSPEPYRGHWVRISAFVRLEPAEVGGAEARLYAEAFGPSADGDSKDLMEERPIRSDAWSEYAVHVFVPEDSGLLQFGLTYIGRGRALVDSFEVEALEATRARPVEARGPYGLDFVVTNADGVPWPWQASSSLPDSGLAVEVVEADGARELVLTTPEGAESFHYGDVSQTFFAAPWHDRRVRMHARARVERVGDGDPWGMVHASAGPAGGRAFPFRTSQEDLLRPGDAIEVELDATVLSDYDYITIGCSLFGRGRLRLSEVTFEEIADARAPSPPRPLSDEGLANLVAFARLYGYVRHFHPSDEALAEDWDTFLLQGVSAVEGATSPEDLARILTELFAPIAPAVRVGLEDGPLELPPELAPPAGGRRVHVVRIVHKGFGDGVIYSSRRSRRVVRDGVLPEGFVDPARPHRAGLGRGIVCAVPLSLYADSKGTLPRGAPREPLEPWIPDLESGNDRGARLVCVVQLWNVLQHFYPYHDVVDTDWDAVLPKALRAAAEDWDRVAFYDTLRRMVAALEDGHARVSHATIDSGATLPILWALVDGEVAVSHVVDSAPDAFEGATPEPGDVLVTMDAMEAAAALERAREVVSGATPGFVDRRALIELGRGATGSVSLLELRRSDGTVFQTRARRFAFPREPVEPRPARVAELEPGLFYVDVARVSDEDFSNLLEGLAGAVGIVFDLRGYPRELGAGFLGHLTDVALVSPTWEVPCPRRPDRSELEFEDSTWTIPPAEPRLSARIVFLTDARAISYAETCLQIADHYDLGTIVGGTTAGTNGNVTDLDLPGGYNVRWTGMRVLKQDGSTFHGVGVVPDVTVEPTLAGLAAGRDELLDAAVEVAREP